MLLKGRRSIGWKTVITEIRIYIDENSETDEVLHDARNLYGADVDITIYQDGDQDLICCDYQEDYIEEE